MSTQIQAEHFTNALYTLLDLDIGTLGNFGPNYMQCISWRFCRNMRDSSLNAIKHKPPTAYNLGNVPKSS